jgi:transcriptional regulator with XRE-family HTH domain
MRSRKTIYGARFIAALRRYREENHLTVEEIAEQAKRPVYSVYKWLQGSRIPGKRTLKQVCHNLGWGYEQFFTSADQFDQIYQDKFFSFSALLARYQYLAVNQPFEASIALAMMGLLAQSLLLKQGVPCRLVVDSLVQVTIFLEPPRNSCSIRIGFDTATSQVVYALCRDIECATVQHSDTLPLTTDNFAKTLKSLSIKHE